MNPSTQRILSGHKEIASFLGVSTKTIQRHLKKLPVARLGAKIMILESDLVQWVQQNRKLPWGKTLTPQKQNLYTFASRSAD